MEITEPMIEAACQVAPDLARSKILEILDAGMIARNKQFPFPPLPWHITTSFSSGRGSKRVEFVHLESQNNEEIITWMTDSTASLDLIKIRAQYILCAVEQMANKTIC